MEGFPFTRHHPVGIAAGNYSSHRSNAAVRTGAFDLTSFRRMSPCRCDAANRFEGCSLRGETP